MSTLLKYNTRWGYSVSKEDLRKAGLKVTLPRIKILQLLDKSEDHHMSAEDIYRSLIEMGEDVGLATVYRVLTQLESAGLVKRHYFDGGQSVFELNQGEHHDHLVCLRCGKVEEFVDPVIEAQQLQIAVRANFQITDHSLNIYGICNSCG